jgi:hypothetical protein
MHPAAVRERGPVTNVARYLWVDLKRPVRAPLGLTTQLTATVGVGGSAGAVAIGVLCVVELDWK